MYSEAIAELQKARDFSRGSSPALSMLGYVYAVSGNRSEAQKVIDQLKQLSKEMYVPPYNVATVYVGLGEKNQAFQWLDKAYEDRDRSLILLKVEPKFDGVRSDPRFTALLKKVGLEK
jgi:Flp pilus assembly protein TadD